MDEHQEHQASALEAAGLSLQEAAARYEVSLRTLGNRVRVGEIDAYKVRGAWGDEWRVSASALEAFGYQRRAKSATGAAADPQVLQLQRELDGARRAAAAERNRADEADRRLGEALMECGRLRALLQQEPQRNRGQDMIDLTESADQGRQAPTDTDRAPYAH